MREGLHYVKDQVGSGRWFPNMEPKRITNNPIKPTIHASGVHRSNSVQQKKYFFCPVTDLVDSGEQSVHFVQLLFV